ncbi:putative pyridoxine 5'-phosphate oxidase superfamily flavin-nucleotide-binding protein [Methanomicrobium sp. W14]|uniref:pyridoxamine 5'-phosphate oxidase family protein n=1 Tax=Methanomicrobium sp. W14 TaxID=2817839 RepID=UPI001AE4069B|nr:pyridoxamine 5'-phosphate oxidase family protein [Methanomicrobium sp. W14]MBP2133270.1 putative pyridoxine 5'-phosphate oxidase superfamily flavin-nucleotide-binding protein [Methanomicrobium sp. W14]
MVKVDEKIKDAFSKAKVIPLATASKDGVPNVAPMGAFYLKDEETLWILNNFMNKTAKNIGETKKAAVYLYGAGIKGCCQIKGDAHMEDSGEAYEEAKKMFLAKNPNLPAKSLLVIKITDVFNCMPGPEAGNKII